MAARRNRIRRLVPVEKLAGDQDLGVWLESARRKLKLRSHCAMHRAIAAQTGLKYDAVHKALTPATGAKRLRAEMVECLQDWLDSAGERSDPGIPDEFRGEPVANLHKALPALVEMLGTKQAVYRKIARETGLRAGTVRRYFQEFGPVRVAPLAVSRCVRHLRQLARPDGAQAAPIPAAKQPDRPKALAQLATEALRAWRRSDGDPQMESYYRALRRDLIADLHARRQMAAGA